MKPLSTCHLYTFIDTAYLHGGDPLDVAKALCDGGSDLIQVRAKSWTEPQIKELVEAILPITKAAGVGLVVNDHLRIAQETGADFCHLGQEDFFDSGYQHIRELPSYVKSQTKIGLSTHAPDQAIRALKAGADYIAIGPVYATGTKPTAKPVSLDYVRWAAENVNIPWFAIGGINLSNLPDVLAAGAQRICVVSAILNSPDVRKACQEFREFLE
jgi:thiamine-phosphate pyrophosphorylase